MENFFRKPVFIVGIGIFVVLIIAGVVLLKQPLSPARKTTGNINEVAIKINYSSPGVKNRKIWGGLLPYNVLWRAGANEATTFEFSTDVVINNTLIKAGKYSFFAIPREEEWTLILNSNTKLAGTTKYNKEKDVIRWQASPEPLERFQERLKYELDNNAIELKWENLKVSIPIEHSK